MSKEKLINNNPEEIIEVVNLPIDIEKGRTYAINQPNPNSYTHGYFKYPCKFIPEIPRWALKKYGKENSNILDPFSGSGTTLLEANINGYNAYGTEIDNLAKLLIKVKTTLLREKEIIFIKDWLDSVISIYKESYLDYINPYIPEINNLYHWFSEENVQKLGIIKSEVSKINNENVNNFLNLCLASSIRKCSKADDVSPKPYVSKKIKKIVSDPFELFPNIVTKYLASMNEYIEYASQNNIGKSQLLNGDALNINTDLQFNLAITSPPYINAFDYGRTLRLENLWLDLESESTIRNKKKEYVGTENVIAKEEKMDLSILDSSEKLKEVYDQIKPVDKKRALIVKRFFEDMKTNLIEVHKVLKSEGRYCIVIGDSMIRKINVSSWEIICDIAEPIGFKLDTHFSYVIKNHYLRIPRGNRGGKINKDYVFVLKKST